jgi:hypothetical protein
MGNKIKPQTPLTFFGPAALCLTTAVPKVTTRGNPHLPSPLSTVPMTQFYSTRLVSSHSPASRWSNPHFQKLLRMHE